MRRTNVRTGRNSTKPRFLWFTRSASARVHDVRKPAEPGLFVDARRTLVVRLGLRSNLVRDVLRQRPRIRERIDEDNAGEEHLTKARVGRVLLQV